MQRKKKQLNTSENRELRGILTCPIQIPLLSSTMAVETNNRQRNENQTGSLASTGRERTRLELSRSAGLR